MWYRNEQNYNITINWTEENNGKREKKAKVLKPFEIVKVPDSYQGHSLLKDITQEMEHRDPAPIEKKLSQHSKDLNNMDFLRGGSTVENRVSIVKYPKQLKPKA